MEPSLRRTGAGMIGGTKVRRGSRWPLFGVVALVCALGVAGAWFLQQRALSTAIATQEDKVTAFVKQTMTPAVAGVDLQKPLGATAQQRLQHQLEKGVLAGGSIVRVRLFSISGDLLFSTDASDKVGSAEFGYPDALRGAAGGALTSLVDQDSVGKGSAQETLSLLRTYAPLNGNGGRTLAVVAVDQRYQPLELASQSPWRTVQLTLGGAAAVFLCLTLVTFLRRNAGRGSSARSGFGTGARRGAPDPHGSKRALEAAEKAAERESQIREALENQLEQLRAKLSEQDDATLKATRELTEQLDAATRRAEEAEARAAGAAGTAGGQNVAPQLREAIDRSTQMEARALAAEAQVAQLEVRVREAEQAAPAAADLPEDLAQMVRELAEARQTATEQQRRALDQEERALGATERGNASQHRAEELMRENETLVARMAELEQAAVQSARTAAESTQRVEAAESFSAALEAKLAQVGTRGQELEEKAGELERRALEAETSGDVVRAELAETAAQRDAFSVRLATFESDAEAVARRVEAAQLEVAQTREQLTLVQGELDRARADLERAHAETAQAATRAGSEVEAAMRAAQADVTSELNAARAQIQMLEAAKATWETSLAEVVGQLEAANERLRHSEVAAPELGATADLERELAETRSQLAQTELRLQGAIADAEEARAQRTTAPPAASDDGSAALEMQQVRLELARAMDRAQTAEERAAKLEADLLALQHGVHELADGAAEPDPDPAEDADGADENGDDVDADGKSLRYRLARTAARKKLSGDIPTMS